MIVEIAIGFFLGRASKTCQKTNIETPDWRQLSLPLEPEAVQERTNVIYAFVFHALMMAAGIIMLCQLLGALQDAGVQ